MTTFNDFLGKVSATFTGSTTTGLDVLETTSVPARVAEELLAWDFVPATPSEVTEAFVHVTGCAPREEDMFEVEQFLLSFDWLA